MVRTENKKVEILEIKHIYYCISKVDIYYCISKVLPVSNSKLSNI